MRRFANSPNGGNGASLRSHEPLLWPYLLPALALSLGGCYAKITTFDVSPHHVCAGEKVTVKWEVKGTPHLKISPPDAQGSELKLSSRGQLVLQPQSDTTLTLHVTRFLGRETTVPANIEVRTGSTAPEAFGASIGDDAAQPWCRDGRLGATVHVQRFAPSVKIDRVTSHPGDDRTYTIRHAGKEAVLNPGTTLTEFQGTSATGDWELSTPLKADEACGTPQLPRNLTFDAYTACSETTAP